MIVSPPVYDLTLFCQSLEGNQNARYPEPGKVCECDGHISLRLWAANLYSQHPFLRLSSPFPSSGIEDSLFSPLATFLEMKGFRI